jgi:hypothetical protein
MRTKKSGRKREGKKGRYNNDEERKEHHCP